MNMEQIKSISSLAATWVAVLSAICGGVVWLNTYVHDLSNKITERQKQTVAFLDRYSSADVVALRTSFHKLRTDVASKLTSPPAYGGPAAADSYENEIQATTLAEIKRLDLGLDMQRLVQFFDQLDSCVNMNVCDKSYAESLFEDEAYYVYKPLQRYIETVDGARPRFGSGLKHIAYLAAAPQSTVISR